MEPLRVVLPGGVERGGHLLDVVVVFRVVVDGGAAPLLHRVAAGDDVEEADRMVGLPHDGAPSVPDLVAHKPPDAVRGVCLRHGDPDLRREGSPAPTEEWFRLALEEVVGVFPLVVAVVLVHADPRQVPRNRDERR